MDIKDLFFKKKEENFSNYKKKKFEPGDWVIFQEGLIHRLLTQELEGKRKDEYYTAEQIVDVFSDKPTDLLFIDTEGRAKYVTSSLYRYATTEEIKKAKLKKMFRK